MSVTLELSEPILEKLRMETSTDEDAAAVQAAVDEYLRRRQRLRELRDAAGKIEMSDHWKCYNRVELTETDE